METKYIYMTCEGREEYATYIKKRIPKAIESYDNFNDAGKFKSTSYKNAQQAWRMAGDNPTVQMEDDIILCDNFVEKCELAIKKTPNTVIQFFSRRKADLVVGTRMETGSKFLMHQCYYLPKGMASAIHEFSIWYEQHCEEGMTSPNDWVTRDFFKQNGISYLVHIPNLVDHRESVSLIDKRRSSKRQSYTFVK